MSDSRSLTLAEVADLAGGRVVGDPSRRVGRMAPLDEAGPGDLSMVAQARYRALAGESRAGALLVKEGFELPGRDQVVVADPHFALVALLPRLAAEPLPPAPGISERAAISPGARIGAGVSIGPFAVVEAGATVGDGARIGAGSYLGANSEVGEGTVLHPNTTVYAGCRLGRRVIVHAGSVIGSDGFGYATRGGVHHKVPQVGAVIVEDDVELGAGVTIDRGSIGNTVIGRGTKIDNLVQIGHNVRVGPGCLIVAQTGISGSTRIGAGTVFAGQSGAAGHLVVGSGVIVASKSAVYGDLPDKAFVAGIPAVDHRRWKRAQAAFGRLPELLARVRAIDDRLGAVVAGAERVAAEKRRGKSQGTPAGARRKPAGAPSSGARKKPAGAPSSGARKKRAGAPSSGARADAGKPSRAGAAPRARSRSKGGGRT